MNLKLLSLAAIAGITGVVAHQFSATGENVEVGKYSPRVNVEAGENSEWNGAAEYLSSIRGNLTTGNVDFADRQRVIDQINNRSSRAGAIGLEFEFMGPANVGGRTRGIIVDNEDPNTIFAGTVTGGVFVSKNGGSTWSKTWTARTNNISGMAQTSDGAIYVGTGCDWESSSLKGGAPADAGHGIYKSTDRGATWTLLPSTENNSAFAVVNDIKAHPTRANVVAVASAGGIQISTDGGDTWTNQSACLTGTTLPRPSKVQTVEWSASGNILYVGFAGGVVYSGSDWDQPCGLTEHPKIPGSSGRYKITVSPNTAGRLYACLTGGGDYTDIVQSNDDGATWASFNPGVPTSAQHYDLFGTGGGRTGQANYDLLFKAVPSQTESGSDVIFLGGVQLWRYDGNWTMAAVGHSTGGAPNPLGVHVDHHICVYDASNPSVVYFGNDGGVYKSLDGGYNFFDINKGLTATQFYAIDHANFDYAIGGTQDNGNLFVTPFRPGNSDYSASVFNAGVVNGDGFDAAVSQFVDLKYTSAQFGNMGRGAITSRQGSGACEPYCNQASFYTHMKLWENDNDLTSQDSILLQNDTIEDVQALGTGTRRTFEGKIEPSSASAQIVAGSIRIGTLLNQLVYDGNGSFTGNGQGTLDESTWEYSITFDDAPQLNARINAYYSVRYDAGSVITVPSATDDIPILYVLRTNLEPGDVLKIQDPVQSMIAMSVNVRCSTNAAGTQWECGSGPGIAIARKALILGENPDWWHFNVGSVSEFEFTPDGNELFYNAGRSSVRMLQGLNNMYSQSEANQIASSPRNVSTLLGGTVTSINFDPNDVNRMLVTCGNYGQTNHISYIQRQPGTTTFVPTVVQGDLPDFPVYDAIFDAENPDRVIIGTDMGIWSTAKLDGANTEWVQEDFPNVPVFDIDQQTLNHQKATNHGMVYVGTHGAGIYKTGTIVSIDQIGHNRTKSEWESKILVYPNPVNTVAQLKLTVNNPNDATMSVYDLSGQLVKVVNSALVAGDNDVSFDASELISGTYFITLNDGGVQKVAKFVKM